MLNISNLQTSQANNSRILRIRNAKFSGYCFYMNTNMFKDFEICVSVPLKTKYQALKKLDKNRINNGFVIHFNVLGSTPST